MKKHSAPIVLLSGLLALSCILAPVAPVSGGTVPATACPALPPVPAGAEVKITDAPRVGRPVQALFDLKGYSLPVGAYASINIDFPQQPVSAAPKVRPGYPETTLTFDAPGTYRMHVILNEISKPSCGGVNARPLLEDELELRVEP